ncbi:MAG TPA: adenylate/guanylate cyclase domain-containing protein [Stellaceae bacterium]|nr:adenylate/guanylate cyclase domain-containing protein [Stellaceae bacterium]
MTVTRAAARRWVSRLGARRVSTLIAVAILAAALSMLAVRYIVPLAYIERFASDLRTAVLLPAERQHPDIIIVAITEETLQLFPYRSPVDRQFLSDLLRLLERRGVRAIGVDVLFDQPTEPSKDNALRRTLDELKVPLAVGYVRDKEIVNTEQKRFLEEFVPPRLRGFSNFATDPVGDTVRWIYPGDRLQDGTFVPGFAYAVAALAGVKAEPRQVEIAWRGQPGGDIGPFRTVPADLVGKLPADLFKNKIVLVGAELSITDRHRTPFAAVFEGNKGVLPGVVIMAHALAQLLDHRVVVEPSWQVAFVMAFAIAVIGACLGAVDLSPLARFGTATAVIIVIWIGGFALFHYDRVDIPLVTATVSLGLATWTMDSLGGRAARKQREFIRMAFSRYVSPKVVDQLLGNPASLALRGVRRDMTFLFTDVAGFTTMAETVGSDELGPLMNEYFEGLCGIVLHYDGTVDKFIGDAIFAIFNAPTEQPDHAARAVKCALDIDRFAEAFRAKQRAQGVAFGVTRVGVHTGRALVGNFGTTARMEFTALGDAVNTAARLEGTNKIFGTRLCASDTTREKCEGMAFRPLGRVVLKGKTKPIAIFEPLSPVDADTEYMLRYGEAYAAIARCDARAPEMLEALHRERPDDGCVAYYRARLAAATNGVDILLTDK